MKEVSFLSFGWMHMKILSIVPELSISLEKYSMNNQMLTSGESAPVILDSTLTGSCDWSSCCVVVKNIQRCLYFLPREKVIESLLVGVASV